MTRIQPRTDCGMGVKTGKRNAKHQRAVDKWRQGLRASVGQCEACGHSPRNRVPGKPAQLSVITVQEIGRGSGLRKLCEDKPYATLVLCWGCNSGDFCDAAIWPIPKQLCLLSIRRPDAYDLTAFVTLLRPEAPRWITKADVAAYLPEIRALCEASEIKPTWRE